MKLLKNLLKRRRRETKMSLTDKDIFYIFKKVIQEEFGQVGGEKIKPDFFKRDTIFVKSENSAWASELWTNRSRIIQKINKELGERIIREIKIK